MALGVVVGATIGGPLLAAYVTGAMAIPSGDDWDYSRIALNWVATGRFRLMGWESATTIGHIVWGSLFLELFGRSLPVLHWATATAAALGLVATFAVFRQTVRGWLALLATAVFAAFPTYALLSATYMTDISAFALQMACLAVGLAALTADHGRRPLLMAVALGLGLVAFTVREFGAAALLAVLTGYAAVLMRERRSVRRAMLAAAGCGTLAAAFLAWRHSLPDSTFRAAPLPPLDILVGIGASYFTLSLTVLPVVVVTAPRRLRASALSRSSALVAVTLIAIAAVIARYKLGSHTGVDLLVGNYVTPMGALGNDVLLGSRPPLVGVELRAVVTALALAAGITLGLLALSWLGEVRKSAPRRGAALARAVRQRCATDPVAVLLGTFAAVTVVGILLRPLTGAPIADRYLWGVTVPVAAILLRGTRRPPAPARAAAAVALTVGFAAMTVILVSNADSYNVARWSAGEAAVRQGSRPLDVDAGYEWVGWHYRGKLLDPAHAVAGQPRRWYLTGLFPAAENCIIVAASPLRESTLAFVDKRSYEWLFGAGRSDLWVYRNPGACSSG